MAQSVRRIRLFTAILLIAPFLLALFPAPLSAAEVIRSFTSDIWIEADGSLKIREQIAVTSEGREIRRGIYRDFPTDYTDAAGHRYRVAFDVESVTRAGRPEPYNTERYGNGVRLYIGSRDVLLRPGAHEYAITYRTTRQIGHFDGFDEIYWNVTGNGWVFPVEEAIARIHLPPGASLLQYSAYTGYQGEQGTAYRAEEFSGGIAFLTTRPLAPTEGLTVAVAWPEGFIPRPTGATRLGYLLSDNRILLIGGIGILLLLAYYLPIWWRVGRDPAPGTIIPLYSPPAGYSPAAMRYIRKMGFDDKTFSAAILSMAVKGYLTIEEEAAGTYTLRKKDEGAALSLGEKAIARHLFAGGVDEIALQKANHSKIAKARNGLRNWLRTEYEGVHFRTNRKHFYYGVAISLVIFALMILFAPDPVFALFISLWLTIWTIGVYFIFRLGLRAWMGFLAGRSIARGIGAILTTVMFLPFLGGEIVGLSILVDAISLSGAVIFLIIEIINLGFYHLLKAPTSFGRQVMDRFAGFADFLSVTEADRMNFFNPPERTPELFEAYLPFAIALDVENEWAEQFSKVFADIDAEAAKKNGYRPAWYHGTRFNPGNLEGFSTAFGQGFTSAISAASRAPGSSSGSSGGGSSGGGGGGGGGGGW